MSSIFRNSNGFLIVSHIKILYVCVCKRKSSCGTFLRNMSAAPRFHSRAECSAAASWLFSYSASGICAPRRASASTLCRYGYSSFDCISSTCTAQTLS